MTGDALPESLAAVPVDALDLQGGSVPTAGSWTRDGAVARFTPRFAVTAGARFAVLTRTDAHARWIEQARVVAPGERPVPTTVVERIDPQVDRLPANVLRFAITFSNAMAAGTAAGRISLHDPEGAELRGTLLEMPPELWDRERRRLTVLLEPGRIKRGLQPNAQAGPPLVEGDSVMIVVDPRMRDAAGTELAAGAHRRYRVGPAVRARVDPTRWTVRWPASGGDPLIVRFDRPLDRSLVRSCLRVVGARAQVVPGHASLDEGACVWMFTPATGEHVDAASAELQDAPDWALHIDTRLEDLAGNSVRRVFDRDLGTADDDSIDASTLILRRDGLPR